MSVQSVKLENGKKYLIKGYDKQINQSYRHHLLAMGLLPGAAFLVRRFAPFSRTVQIDLEQFSLSLREAELQAFLIEPCC
ncbi:MAG: FeoA domain-containing protein [Gammaproteobacteria bacterium]|nr:FeoA domain-containing protein [Gammaproteobacteria bacterium]